MDKREKVKLYESLVKLKSDTLGNILKHLDDNSIDAICECVYNVVHSDLKLSPTAKRKLKRKLQNNCTKKNLHIIMKKKNSLSKRRKALSQEGSGIGLILATVVPLLAKLLFNKKGSE
ncbi:MAG: hypothetical protein ACRCZ7_19725 [Aeromonas sobria]